MLVTNLCTDVISESMPVLSVDIVIGAADVSYPVVESVGMPVLEVCMDTVVVLCPALAVSIEIALLDAVVAYTSDVNDSMPAAELCATS